MTTISSSSRRQIRPRQRQPQFTLYNGLRMCIGVSLILLLILLWNKFHDDTQPDGLVDEEEEPVVELREEAKNTSSVQETSPEPTPEPYRVLIFDADKAVNSDEHRGAGQLLQGLLAAQLLGLEFDRTVCVQWQRFWRGFDYVNAEQEQLCQRAMERTKAEAQDISTISVWRDEPFVDECDIFDTLNDSKQYPLLYFQGNSYPGGWRSEIPSDLFGQYYRPKPVLQQSLPEKAPRVVIHLRGDLDDEMLYYLGELMRGENNYLVTNELKYVDRFKDCCGWSYDEDWGLDEPIQSSVQTDDSDEEQTLKLWKDWFIMMQASRVYQTPNSAFSDSALHWNAPHTTGYQLNGLTEMTTNTNGQRDTIKVLKLDQESKKRKKVPTLMEKHRLNLLHHCSNPGGGKIRKGALRRFFKVNGEH